MGLGDHVGSLTFPIGQISYPPPPPLWQHRIPMPEKRPHRCPICAGRGEVAASFYDSERSAHVQVQCRACSGRGVIIA